MEWRNSGSNLPENSDCKNPLENLSPRFFVIKTASSSLVIFQCAKLSTRRISYLWWCNWRTFGKKNATGRFMKVVLYPHDNASAKLPLATHKNLAYLCFQCLDHPPYSPDRARSEYRLYPGPKNQLKFRHFSSEVGFIACRRLGWTGNITIFLICLQGIDQWTKKCIELRGSIVNKFSVWSL